MMRAHHLSFLDELQKSAKTRSVKEWQAATAAGQHGTADQIAQASGQLGLKPRQIADISIGGAEAGVDKMMGHAGGGVGPAPNESGYIARKLYKPDSEITQAEFTPKLLAEKQHYTDTARAMSPEAKAMVPAMYGHQTMGAGTELQRTVSHHEFVPGLSDLRGTGKVQDLKSTVLDPMKARGMQMADTASATGANWGNVVNSPSGPKVLDFLPQPAGQMRNQQAAGSLTKYLPSDPTKFHEQGQNLGALRKEVFNPTMRSVAAAPEAQADARSVLQHIDSQARLKGMQQSMAPAANAALHTAPTNMGAARGVANAAMHTAPTNVGAGMLNRGVQAAGKLEQTAATAVPGMLRRAGSALGHLHV